MTLIPLRRRSSRRGRFDLGDYENALRAARSLWLASGKVDEEEFRIFVRSLDRETR